MIFQPIHHTFGPLADRRQRSIAWKFLLRPWARRIGPEVELLRSKIGDHFQGEAFLFGSGRESLLAILSSIANKKGEEIIVQGYTCVVVPNAIIAAGLTPVYADIERDTLNVDIAEVERAISPQTRAIICQHTFGIPSYTKQLRDLCDRHSLILIEDCAHIIPDRNGPSDIGKYGDILFCSFGRDKAVSGVTGGAVICKRKDICEGMRRQEEGAVSYGILHVKTLLFYPIIYGFCRPLYGIGIGKILLALASKLRLLVPIVTGKEKKGQMKNILHTMPNVCAAMALDQLSRIDEINDHRRVLTKLYFEEGTRLHWPLLLGVSPDLPLQKFPLFVKGAENIRQKLKENNIHLHDGWTGCVICPEAVDCELVGYNDGDDPQADMVGEQILSLPTHTTMTERQARYLISQLTPLIKQ